MSEAPNDILCCDKCDKPNKEWFSQPGNLSVCRACLLKGPAICHACERLISLKDVVLDQDGWVWCTECYKNFWGPFTVIQDADRLAPEDRE